jgi:nicotinamide riboside transporter PnuC
MLWKLYTFYLLWCRRNTNSISFNKLYGKLLPCAHWLHFVRFNLAHCKMMITKKCISVHRVVQKVVRDRVISTSSLIEGSLRCWHSYINIYSNFQSWIMERKQSSTWQTWCELNIIFLQHWDLNYTYSLAASVVMMTEFFYSDSQILWKKSLVTNGH